MRTTDPLECARPAKEKMRKEKRAVNFDADSIKIKLEIGKRKKNISPGVRQGFVRGSRAHVGKSVCLEHFTQRSDVRAHLVTLSILISPFFHQPGT